jgi:methionine aminopeptidase
MQDESVPLADGDVAKIDLGCHLDGFVAQAAHTVVVQGDASAKVTGKRAETVLAAYNAFRAAQRLIKEEGTNTKVT